MAHVAGRGGQVDIETIEITGIRRWSITYNVATGDVTDFADSGVRAVTPTISSWSGTFEGPKDGVPVTLGTSATSVTLKLYESQTANQYWEGEAFITGIDAAVDFDGVDTYNYSFEGTGALTVPTA